MTPLDTMSHGAHIGTLKPSSPNLSRARSQSISSDRTSIGGYGGLLSPPASTNPEPLYIAASAASQIVTNDHDSHSEMWFDQHGIEPSGETALVAPGALKLVNKFLDQILFNFLSLSRSTSLASLRPAVKDVLKPKLASDAINLADGELHEYLGGGEEEELLDFHNGTETNGDWDLELVWKRTRLRCMVYSSLGDMEEEDEDHYTELEQLDALLGNRFSSNSAVVSPAVAIFLTSILEFMGEQVLVVAGQAAYHRLRAKHEKEEREGTGANTGIADRVVVEEMDMERVALDRTLGRLWRGWKKRIRSPTPSMSLTRSYSRDSLQMLLSRNHNRIDSISGERFLAVEETPQNSSTTESALGEHAASIPLPTRDTDVREIEIPGLVYYSDEEDEEPSDDDEPIKMRPRSLVLPRNTTHPLTPDYSQPQTPAFLSTIGRTRSNSLPSQYSPSKKSRAEQSHPKVDRNHDEILEWQKSANSSSEKQSESNKGMIAGVIAGAAAIGAVAAAGIKAVATGHAPETVQTPGEESDMEEAFIEEPRIMTSSRISMHGRASPDEAQAGSQPMSIQTQSRNSVRLVDVPPQSPTRSRDNSVGSIDQITGRQSRSGSADGQRGPSPVSRVATSSPLIRNVSSCSQRQAMNSATDPISEFEERQVNPPERSIPERSLLRGTVGPTSMATASIQRSDMEKSQIRSREPTVTEARMSPNLSNGATSLTPLHEIMEGANETSNEGSSANRNNTNMLSRTYSSSEEHAKPIKTRISSQKQLEAERLPRTDSQNKPTRKLHTASSSTSSSSNKIRPIRTSEDGARSPYEDKSKAFEDLIQSDQTIQYTLTPQSVRETEYFDSPRAPKNRTSSNSSGSKFTALRSNPPLSPKMNQAAPRPAVNSGAKVRSGVGQARDARVDRDSIGDFAEFIRSTGPPGATFDDLPPRNAPAANGHRGQNGVARNASASIPRVSSSGGIPNANGTPPSSATPRRSQSSATRRRLEAREAVVPHTNDSSDLIDFIRQGPPSGKTGNPRIPRTVAPFRTTMDSDQMSGAVGARVSEIVHEEPRISQTSTHLSNGTSTQSLQSSVNSHSALLNSYKQNKPAPTSAFGTFDEEDMMPKRKTRRVKDPYAIDYSDEEDDLFDDAPPPKPKPVREESLIDFLNSVPPPPPSVTVPFTQSVDRPVTKKSSAPSLMARFSRNSMSHGKAPSSSMSSPSSRANNYSPQATGHNPIGKSIPSSSPNTLQKRAAPPMSSNYVSRLDSERKPAQVHQISYQSREAGSGRGPPRSAAAELADFLMNEPPPPSNGPQRLAINAETTKEERGFGRMFSRLKKAGAA